MNSPLADGVLIRAADMPGTDHLTIWIDPAIAQKERELISERTKAALAAAKARGKKLGGDRGYRPITGPDAAAATRARREAAGRRAHQLALEVSRLHALGVCGAAAVAKALTIRGVATPTGNGKWTHATVMRVLNRSQGVP